MIRIEAIPLLAAKLLARLKSKGASRSPRTARRRPQGPWSLSSDLSTTTTRRRRARVHVPVFAYEKEKRT